ncbi:UNVERIFIED_CONTAM: hypothetical protein GTU68_050764 [Idotea baltica]|nr:hypothetical protein [Idotea baltica]
MAVIAGRWKAEITWHLCGTTRRFNELRRLLPGITPKMLTQQLRALERDGIISRVQHNEIPPRVEYRTTELGDTLGPVFSTLGNWGLNHSDQVDQARAAYDGQREP